MHACMYMCICMYVCMYVCMYIIMYVWMCVCVCICMYACVYACMCVCMYVCILLCMCECVYMYVCMCVCMYVCMCVCGRQSLLNVIHLPLINHFPLQVQVRLLSSQSWLVCTSPPLALLELPATTSPRTSVPYTTTWESVLSLTSSTMSWQLRSTSSSMPGWREWGGARRRRWWRGLLGRWVRGVSCDYL